METRLILGAEIRDRIFNDLELEISSTFITRGERAGIAFIACLGHLPLMKYTVALHRQAALELGFHVSVHRLSAQCSTENLLHLIEKLNADAQIQAIVVLQPLPRHLDPIEIIGHIAPQKEVEGFHPQHILQTMARGFQNTAYPMCLPTALNELFTVNSIQFEANQQVVFAVDNDFLENPFRRMVLQTAISQSIPSNCTLTIANTESASLRTSCRRADFLFVVSEKPSLIDDRCLKPGACVVDIYTNLVGELPSKKHPDRMIPLLKGAVNTDAVMGTAGSIAPCPGGLMPVLLAVLFRNCVSAFKTASATYTSEHH